MMQPVPETAVYRDPGYYVWCGTMIKDENGLYHLYYSRWKESAGPSGWLTSSEVAHATSRTPTGPFIFHDVTLAARGRDMWDGMSAHNPTIQRFAGKYYLYYMGDTGDGLVTTHLNWTHRNNQRIGVAISDSPNGPWLRSDRPIIDVSADKMAPDSLCVSNPSLTRGRDGRYYLLYKAVGHQKPLPYGGPVVHLMATSDSPAGPFTKELEPLFSVAGSTFPFEDPYFWYDARRDQYFTILKDMKGVISGLGHASLVLYQSPDARHWKAAQHLLVSDLEIKWEDRPVETVSNLERPQLLFDAAGSPIVLIAAIKGHGAGTYNVRIPLSATQ